MMVVIEGTDASGKATQSKLLADRLGARRFSFPNYETPMGKAILRHLKGLIEVTEGHGDHTASEDALIFQAMCLANKCEMLPEMWRLPITQDIVCDRWWPSSVAYGKADGLDGEWLRKIHQGLQGNDVVYIFLDVPDDEALRRRPKARDRYEENREKQRQVRENYQQLWAAHAADSGWYVVNGVGLVGEIHEEIYECVLQERGR
jgi:dTMP kinase